MATHHLSPQINRVGVKAVFAVIATSVLSLFFPLDAPAPTQEAAAFWLMNTNTGYIFGWLNQIAAMLALSYVIAVAAWQVYDTHPLSAITSWVATLMATLSFFIVKFINVWSVPLMAKALASGAPESANAEVALSALAPSVAFGFGPSLDYLGFLFYAIACLVIWRSLYKVSTSGKIAGIGFLLFGVFFFLGLFAPYFSLLGQADIEYVVVLSALPLLVAILALYFRFKDQSKA